MSNRLVVVHADDADSLVGALRAAREPSYRLNFVHLDDLAPFIHQAAWPIVMAGSFPDSVCRMFDNSVVLNRVFSFGNTKLHEKISRWSCHEQWIHLSLTPLFDRANGLLHDTGVRGVSRCMLPLNTQWFLLNQACSNVCTPKFVFAFGGEAADLAPLIDPMQKSVWSLFDWREESQLNEREASWHRFYVERPRGVPVVCGFFGEELITYTFPREPVDLDEALYKSLVKAAKRLFKSEVGELLTFIEDDGAVKFYAFSPLLRSTASHADFEGHAHEWLTRLH